MGGWVFYTPKPNEIVVQEDEDWGSILSTIWQALSQAGDPESGSLYCCPGLRDSSFLQGDYCTILHSTVKFSRHLQYTYIYIYKHIYSTV